MYFKFFDTFPYTLNNKDYEFINLFKRIAFSNKTKNNKKIFTDYYVSTGDTPEYIAHRFYNDESLGWFIILINDLVNKTQFPVGLDEVERNARLKYPGSSIYFKEYIPNLIPGDILVKCTISGENVVTVDNTKYAIVQEYNNTFRYAIVTENKGLSQNDFVVLKRLTKQSGDDVTYPVLLSANSTEVIRNFAQISKITEAIESPIEFLNANSNYRSPYYINDQYEAKSSAIGTYATPTLSDVNTVANTLLVSYLNGITTPNIKTIFSKYVEDNNKNRIIKILKPVYTQRVFSAIQELLMDNNIRIKTIEIEG